MLTLHLISVILFKKHLLYIYWASDTICIWGNGFMLQWANQNKLRTDPQKECGMLSL
jgi:hypothetical protein